MGKIEEFSVRPVFSLFFASPNAHEEGSSRMLTEKVSYIPTGIRFSSTFRAPCFDLKERSGGEGEFALAGCGTCCYPSLGRARPVLSFF